MKSARPSRRSFHALALALLVTGAVLMAGPVAHAVQARASAREAKAAWASWGRSHAGEASVNAGEPALWLRVPSCKLSTLVLQESDAEALHRYPAVRQLASGTRVVFAHRDVHFRSLADLHVGDKITTESADGRVATYLVRTIRILLPEQVNAAVEASENGGTLHLLTCHPFHYLGAAPKRFLVTATEKSRR